VANRHIRANDAEKAQLNVRIKKMNDYIKAFGKEFNFPVYDYHKVFTGDLESKESLMRVPANCGSYDGIHPNEAGYRLLAAELKKLIVKLNYPTDGIICVGDSITYGAHMKKQGSVFGDTYPAELLRLLEK
jgi:lysophospholipase L1-like esterase